MGQLDQLAKEIFAEETESVTGGAAVWDAPGEVGLSAVQLDGLLRVRVPERLSQLKGAWEYAAGHDELVLEVKMPGDHLDFAMLNRAVLRRQAWQVRRIEDPDQRWDGEEPLWVVAPHVPAMLAERRSLTALSRGCYAVGPCFFPFLWFAANELPLSEELIPFLIARSGRPLDDFARWVATRRPREWVMRVVQILPMSSSVREDILRYVPRTDDPEIRARQRHVAQVLLDMDPELREQVNREAAQQGFDLGRKDGLKEGVDLGRKDGLKEGVDLGRKDGLKEGVDLGRKDGLKEGVDLGRREGVDLGRKEGVDLGRHQEARVALRCVLEQRGLAPSPEENARIESCADLAILHRWLKQAVLASCVSEALV